jgi:hypothetical protein
VRAPHQVWGVEKFSGHDAAGHLLELSVYGRDATDARAVAKLWRYCFYRDSGPTLILDRFQQVEHEAYMTFMAVRAGVLVPEVLAVGQFGPSGDAVGEDASLATLLVVITAASMTGGTVPVPGGADVVEAGLIAGLTSAGVPEDPAVAAVFIQRLFTAYLPPIWGWITLNWMRRREYV